MGCITWRPYSALETHVGLLNKMIVNNLNRIIL
jgi:hypothetical protein